ncbi:50S ribosomal protein L3 [Thermithiobacillus plumbiphilus]|uniref:Large ribosomal subunit protein uL3 n=1 Tax=Thermithiobacillus plumbiphilus TaxID=1729899 RepID=A0ABU9DAI4_9PROT
MSIGLVGRKLGMTRVVQDNGASVGVTVLEVTPNRIAQVKTPAVDGYTAIQVTFGERRPQRVTKPMAGHFAKAGIQAGRSLREFTVDDVTAFQAGADLTLEIFEAGQMVDVSAISKGKGFAGAIKRHNFSSNRATHGNSLSHRAPGSIGNRQTPGRVFKGKRMAGQLGAERVTMQNLEIIRVDMDRNLLLVKGAVPGSKGADVEIRPAVKAR